MAIRILVNTLMTAELNVKTIYQLDAAVELAVNAGCDEIEINEPSQAVLDQLNRLRPNYQLTFKVY